MTETVPLHDWRKAAQSSVRYQLWSRRWKALAKALWRQLRWKYVATLRLRREGWAILECEGCRLRNTVEPSVRLRVDGKARCNDCSAQWEGWRPPRGRELEWREWLR